LAGFLVVARADRLHSCGKRDARAGRGFDSCRRGAVLILPSGATITSGVCL
jgi:hypothetical protein